MLIKQSDVALLGRKALLKSDVAYEVIVVDATKALLKGPKKAEDILLRKEKAAYLKKPASVR